MMKSIALTIGILLAGAAIASGQAETRPETALRAAMELETVKGDLRGAIERYRKLADGKDRAVAVKALLRMAQCQEKLGQSEARRAYERILREYSGEQQYVAIARARLAAMGDVAGRGGGMRLRMLDTGDRFSSTGGVSSDGRLIAFTDYVKGGGPSVYDTVTRQEKRLTDFDWDAQRGFGDENAISRDGRWVAFNYYRYGGRDVELRVVGTDGGSMRGIHKGATWTVPQDWTPDGKNVVALLVRSEKVVDLCLVSAADGKVSVLKQFSARPQHSRVSPDGKYLTYIDVDRNSRIMSIDGTSDEPLFASDPLARPMDWTPDGKGLVFASERSGANALWHVEMKGGRPEGQPRMVRAGVEPGVTPVGISTSGALYLVEHSTLSNSYIVPVDLAAGTTGTRERTTRLYEGMNGFAAWSPDGRKLAWFGLKRGWNVAGGTLMIRDLDSGRERAFAVPEDASKNSAPEWLSDNRSIIYWTDPLENMALMRIDTQTGESTRISQGSPLWHSTVSRDGKTLYYVKRREEELAALDTQTRAERKVASLKGQVMPRALALSPDEKNIAYVVQYVKVENGDRSIEGHSINLLDLTSGQSRVFKPYGKKDHFVGWFRRPLLFSPDGKGIVATSQAEGENSNYVRLFPLSGDEPKILVQSTGDLNDVSISPDGRKIAYTESTAKSDLWVLENFLPAK